MIRLAVRCPAAIAERVLAELLELVPEGVEEVGPIAAGRVEYAIYGPPGELPSLPQLEAMTREGPVEILATEIPDDWADRWRDFHHAISIGDGRLVVRPSWELPSSGGRARTRGDAEAPAIDVVVDPGQAFGTGAHASTRMCLELLLELAETGLAGGPLVDLGTGSGVLALAAAKLGWKPVLGCDSEAAAIAAARRNAEINGVELELERLDLREQAPPWAPTMVANLTRPLLAAVASRLAELPRRLVCSGLLRVEVESVRATLAAAGLETVAERSRGEWAALLCRDAASAATGR